MRKTLVYFLLCYLVSGLSLVYGYTTDTLAIKLSDTQEQFSTLSKARIYVDFDQKETIQTIRNLEKDKFQLVTKPSEFNLNHKAKVIWLNLKVSNPSDKAFKGMMLTTSFALEKVHFWTYAPEGELVNSYKSGWKYPTSERSYQGRKFSAPLVLEPEQSLDIWIKFQGGYMTNGSTIIVSDSKLREIEFFDAIYFAFYYGILLGILFYNLFSLYTMRDINYLNYSLFLISFVLVISSYDAPFEFWVNKKFGIELPKYKYIASCFVAITGHLLSIFFYKTHKRILKINYTNHIMLGIALLILSAELLFDLRNGFLTFVNTIGTVVFILAVAIAYYIDGFKPTRFIIIAVASILVASVGFRLAINESSIPYYYAEKLVSFGSLLELTFMSIALTDRFNSLRLSYIEGLKNTQDVLERRVQERTEKLQELNSQLSDEVSQKTDALELVKQQQRELVHSAKMNSLGEMAKGVAHLVNNPLTVLKGNSKIFAKLVHKQDAASLERLPQVIEKTDQAITRIASIINSLRDLTRVTDEVHLEATQIVEIIRNSVEMAEFKAKQSKVNLNFNPEADPVVKADETKIGQAIFNLINDAIENSSHKHCSSVEIELTLEPSVCMVKIYDNGKELSPEESANLFTPFSEESQQKMGSTLGLNMAYNIAKEHGGDLSYQADEKCFSLSLQLAS